MSSGARINAAASNNRLTRLRAPPPPTTASTRSAFTASTTNVTPHTPVIVARCKTVRSSTCETPSDPQLNPPSGQAVRTQSVTVHRDANPTAVSSGRP